MKQQKYYKFLQKQILLMVFLSLIPAFVYVIFGYIHNVFLSAILWYSTMILASIYGIFLYRWFENEKMEEEELERWYGQVITFMSVIFSLWTANFVIFSQEVESNLHYIAIFTQLGASVVASALLVSERKIFVPILFILMLPLVVYFSLLGIWYGYILSIFSIIFLGVLLYSSSVTYSLIQTSYYNAQHDALTGLKNRLFYLEYVEEMIERLSYTDKKAYIFLIDLDHFKTINDSLGHDVGDEVLKEVASRINKYCHDFRVVARLGGDEFIVLSRETDDIDVLFDSMHTSAEEILEILKQPYIIGDHRLYITASIGIAKIDNSFENSNSFLKEADIAMYEAKAEGRDGIIVFNKLLSDKVNRNLLIEQKLYDALKKNIIKMHYQPIFNKDKKMIGCEALVRWTDEELEVLSPNEFIPIAENTGLISDLGIYVLRKTFNTLHSWHEQGIVLEHFSINVSMRQLLNEVFLREVEILYSYYFSKQEKKPLIIFEITEHAFSKDIKKVIVAMNRLKNLNISFSIDDFGTGYSSLSYLQILPIDEIKIDRSFVSGVGKKDTNEAMVIAVLSIAENFSFKTVAEGIETKEQFTMLKEYNCDFFQGFYFDKALSKEIFEEKYLLT